MSDIEKTLKNFKPSEMDTWIFEDPEMLKRIKNQMAAFPCIALPEAENPAVIIGVIHEMGRGELWMLVGDNFKDRLKTVILQSRALIKTTVHGLSLNSLHMRVDSRRADAKAFAEYMGFVLAGTVSGFGFRGEDLDYYILEKGNIK